MGVYLKDDTFIIKNVDSVEKGVKLPKAVAAHCMVHIEDRYFMIIGGFDNPYKMASPASYYINYITGDYLELPNLHLARANHVCMKWVSLEGELMVIIFC